MNSGFVTILAVVVIVIGINLFRSIRRTRYMIKRGPDFTPTDGFDPNGGFGGTHHPGGGGHGHHGGAGGWGGGHHGGGGGWGGGHHGGGGGGGGDSGGGGHHH